MPFRISPPKSLSNSKKDKWGTKNFYTYRLDPGATEKNGDSAFFFQAIAHYVLTCHSHVYLRTGIKKLVIECIEALTKSSCAIHMRWNHGLGTKTHS